jgi:translocation and assembly module TamB
MAQTPNRRMKAPWPQFRRDWGRSLAQLFCLLFALVGAIPLSGGALLGSQPVQAWAAAETSRILRQELGVEANFSASLSLIPLRLSVTALQIPSKSGGQAAIEVGLAQVSPRFFSLLAGRIDVGDIELEDTTVRLVVRDGKIVNVAYKLPEASGTSPELTRVPFRSLAISNAQVTVDLDGTLIQTEGIDLDAFAEQDFSFDVALRTDGASIKATRELPPEKHQASSNVSASPLDAKGAEPISRIAHDDDRLCALDFRMTLSREQVVVRRFSMLGALDLDEAENSNAPCDPTSEGSIALRLSQMKFTPQEEGLPKVRGHVMSRVPLALADRITPGIGGKGWAGYSGDINLDKEMRLPELSGQISGEAMAMRSYAIASKLSAELMVTGDVVHISKMAATWGNGESFFEGIRLAPFEDKMPLHVEKIVTKNVDFPGVMRDIDVTAHSWIDWNFGDTTITKVTGTLAPFLIDGGIDAKTHDFVVWDRGFDDPSRRHMLGIPHANVAGRFRAHSSALDFYNCDLTFGSSSMPVELVSVPIGHVPLVVRLKEGGGLLDLADVSPIAGLELSGKSKLFADLKGPPRHPVLKGNLAVQDLVIAGFEAGNILESEIHFEPLFVDFLGLKGQKGEMDYALKKARLSFDGPASVELTADVQSENFNIEEFFRIFHLDEDHRFDGIEGNGALSSRVRYLLGGPEDVCGEGRVFVNGSSKLRSAEFFGEQYGKGDAEFEFEWFDMAAGASGMRINVPSLNLQKGSGSIFGSVMMHPGGLLSGDFLGTRIPVSRIDSLAGLFSAADGFVTGVGQLRGTVDSLAISADVDMTALESSGARLSPSHLQVELIPAKKEKNGSVGPKTHCGRAVSPKGAVVNPEDNTLDGTFHLQGSLFGGQIALKDITLTRQHKMVLQGEILLQRLSLNDLGQIIGGDALRARLPGGVVSGTVRIDDYFLDAPLNSRARLDLEKADLTYNGLRLDSVNHKAAFVVNERKIWSENVTLRATTERGENGLVDVAMTIDEQSQLEASFDLRPTNLDILAAAVPGISEADGELSAHLGLKGSLADPQIFGFIAVKNGKLLLDGFKSPVSDLELNVRLEQSGLHVVRGDAQWGGGKITMRGDAPISDGQLGRTNLSIVARSVHLPIEQDIDVTFDADLRLAVPAPSRGDQELPLLSGAVNVLSASYEKPMSITADISTLAARGAKTEVEGYDETKNNLRLDLLLRSSKPLRVDNELVTTTLMIDPAGLRITGTDQRYGAVGTVAIEAGGRVFLRRNEFEVQRGLVRFNDPTRLRPEVDMTAVTEYRRYEDRGATEGESQAGENVSSNTKAAGNWRILLHAYGPPDELKVDLNSDPPLAQDDIFLLLTVGLTRTELDQTQRSGVSSSVALEALGSLSGAEGAVTDVVPVDEFRFGSAYSSRSGRTEPTVTIGKRLSRRIRASVTTSLSDTSEVRSNVEYRATENLSVEGSYDNAGDVASATGGNLGGDVRWRLEFE